MFVRLICRAQHAKTPDQLPFWPRLAYRYAMALKEAGIPTRIVSVAIAQYGKGSAWRDLEGGADGFHAFTRNIPENGDFVNVVCEVPRVAARMWTAGRWNIAIAAVEHVPPPATDGDQPSAKYDEFLSSLGSYNFYDYQLTPSPAALGIMRPAVMNIEMMAPADFPGWLCGVVGAHLAHGDKPKDTPPFVDNAALEKMFEPQMAEAKRAIDYLTETNRGGR